MEQGIMLAAMNFMQITTILWLITLFNYGSSSSVTSSLSDSVIFNGQLTFADDERSERVTTQLHTFSKTLLISFNSSQQIKVCASFCAQQSGLVIGQGMVDIITLSPSDLFELRQSTKCKYDTDPFYEEAENVNKSFYLTMINHGNGISPIVNLHIISTKDSREHKHLSAPSFWPQKYPFNLTENEDKKISVDVNDHIDQFDLEITLDRQIENSSIEVLMSVCDGNDEKHLANVSIEISPYSLQLNGTELNDLLVAKNCTENINRTLLFRIHSWSEQAIGEIFYDKVTTGMGPEVMSAGKTVVHNVVRTVFNTIVENLGANEAKTVTGPVYNISDGLEFHMNITKGSFAISAGFCATLEASIGSFDVGEWHEVIGGDRLQKIYNKTICANNHQQNIRKRRMVTGHDEEAAHTIHVTLIGKSTLNSGTFFLSSRAQLPIVPGHFNDRRSFFAVPGNWLYFAYGVIVLFAIATVASSIFLLRRFLSRRRGVNDFTTINAYNDNPPGAKIEETTSRTWI